jgi:hypothetical protein
MSANCCDDCRPVNVSPGFKRVLKADLALIVVCSFVRCAELSLGATMHNRRK